MDHCCSVSVVHVGGPDAAGGATSIRKRFRSHLDMDVRAIPSLGCGNSSAYET